MTVALPDAAVELSLLRIRRAPASEPPFDDERPPDAAQMCAGQLELFVLGWSAEVSGAKGSGRAGAGRLASGANGTDRANGGRRRDPADASRDGPGPNAGASSDNPAGASRDGLAATAGTSAGGLAATAGTSPGGTGTAAGIGRNRTGTAGTRSNGTGVTPGPGARRAGAAPTAGRFGAADAGRVGEARGGDATAVIPKARASAPAAGGAKQPDPGVEARRAASRFVAACVEVLNGYRPATHLRTLTSPFEFTEVAKQLAQPRMRVRIVDSRHAGADRIGVRRLHVFEPRDGIAEAAAVLSHGDATWAVALRLERRRGTWLCTLLQVV